VPGRASAPSQSLRRGKQGTRYGGLSKTVAWVLVVIPLLLIWWTFILGWYGCFGLLLLPYRLLRRGARKREAEALRHRELLAAVEQKDA
jgi:hypothetical protein